MDPEIIESVLEEILGEQKSSLKVAKELSVGIYKLDGKIDSVQQRLEQQKVVVPPTDTNLVQAIVSTGIRQIQQAVKVQPKNTVRQFWLLLFSEQFAE